MQRHTIKKESLIGRLSKISVNGNEPTLQSIKDVATDCSNNSKNEKIFFERVLKSLNSQTSSSTSTSTSKPKADVDLSLVIPVLQAANKLTDSVQQALITELCIKLMKHKTSNLDQKDTSVLISDDPNSETSDALKYFSDFIKAENADIDWKYVALYTVGLGFAFVANYPNYRFAGIFGVNFIKYLRLIPENSQAEVWSGILQTCNYLANLFVNAKSQADTVELMTQFIKNKEFKKLAAYSIPSLCASVANIQFAIETTDIKTPWGKFVAAVGFSIGVALNVRGINGLVNAFATDDQTHEAAVAIRRLLIEPLDRLLTHNKYSKNQGEIEALCDGLIYHRKNPISQKVAGTVVALAVVPYSVGFFNAAESAMNALDASLNISGTAVAVMSEHALASLNTASDELATFAFEIENNNTVTSLDNFINATTNISAAIGFLLKAGLLSYATYKLFNQIYDRLVNEDLFASLRTELTDNKYLKKILFGFKILLDTLIFGVGLLSTAAAMGSTYKNLIDNYFAAAFIGFAGAVGINTFDFHGFIYNSGSQIYDLFIKKCFNTDKGQTGHLILDTNKDDSVAFEKIIRSVIQKITTMSDQQIISTFSSVEQKITQTQKDSEIVHKDTTKFVGNNEYQRFKDSYSALQRVRNFGVANISSSTTNGDNDVTEENSNKTSKYQSSRELINTQAQGFDTLGLAKLATAVGQFRKERLDSKISQNTKEKTAEKEPLLNGNINSNTPRRTCTLV